MHFVLTLHSHLPWVLNHGRWPHGSDWLCEAALDTYLPLLEALRALDRDGVQAPVTLGITPVLANQLANPAFAGEFEAFLEQRLEACREAPASLRKTGDEGLLSLVEFWNERITRYRELFEEVGKDLPGAFRDLATAGRLEIISSAATHGFLPLLGRQESIRLQLAVGASEHQRIFGSRPRGCWVPECAYRPAGPWDPIPGTSTKAHRAGVEAFLEEAGFRYFFMDTHMAEAGTSLAVYGDIPQGVERFDAEWHGVAEGEPVEGDRSPYQSFLVDSDGHGAEVSAFVRDPRSSMQVWSRHHGYPGDEWYLEFHKIRWPGGLKYWRVTGPNLDLGAKTAYVPEEAGKRVRAHASHFAGLLKEIRDTEGLGASGVVMAPFDTELFGHWWFEGVDFIREVYTAIAGPATGPIPVTASEHLDSFPSTHAIRPLEGSWGANGDFSMWLNPETRWTWERLWPLEERFWTLAPGARADETRDEILAQAGRQLLLAQSSDWQFMISTGAVPDYAEKRFNLHCDDLEELLRALEPQASPEAVEQGRRKAAALDERDDLFPNILDSLDRVLRRD